MIAESQDVSSLPTQPRSLLAQIGIYELFASHCDVLAKKVEAGTVEKSLLDSYSRVYSSVVGVKPEDRRTYRRRLERIISSTEE